MDRIARISGHRAPGDSPQTSSFQAGPSLVGHRMSRPSGAEIHRTFTHRSFPVRYGESGRSSGLSAWQRWHARSGITGPGLRGPEARLSEQRMLPVRRLSGDDHQTGGGRL